MATSPNFSWPEPDNTDLVKNGALAIRTAVDAIDSSMADLKGGTTGQVLKKNSNTDMDFVWSADSAGMTNPMTTTGDTIYSSSGSTPARLGIGSSGQVLTVSGGVPTWATPSSGTPTFVGCVAYRGSAQSLTSGTFTVSNFPSESFDTNSFHSTSSNTSRITIPTGYAGKYLFFAGDVDIETSGQCFFTFYKNGSTADPTGQGTYSAAVNTGGSTARIGGSIIVNAAVGDYFELAIYTDAGAGNSNRAVFGCTYLGA